MAPILNVLLAISLISFLIISAAWAKTSGEWRPFVVQLIAALMFSVILHKLFGFPFLRASVIAKGDEGKPLLMALALYLCMVIGMLAQFLYLRLAQPDERRKKWDWGNFLAPVFTSPIVFLPLLAALQGAGLDLKVQTGPRIMLFLVAFENGFFWKDFFDRQRREASKKR
jgi:predicted permease